MLTYFVIQRYSKGLGLNGLLPIFGSLLFNNYKNTLGVPREHIVCIHVKILHDMKSVDY